VKLTKLGVTSSRPLFGLQFTASDPEGSSGVARRRGPGAMHHIGPAVPAKGDSVDREEDASAINNCVPHFILDRTA
jgi:hypothetical protein